MMKFFLIYILCRQDDERRTVHKPGQIDILEKQVIHPFPLRTLESPISLFPVARMAWKARLAIFFLLSSFPSANPSPRP